MVFINFVLMIIGVLNVARNWSAGHALLFFVLYMVFVIGLLGLPSLIGILRCIDEFRDPKDAVSGIIAQCLLILVLCGILFASNLQNVIGFFIVGGLIMGVFAPGQSLRADIRRGQS